MYTALRMWLEWRFMVFISCTLNGFFVVYLHVIYRRRMFCNEPLALSTRLLFKRSRTFKSIAILPTTHSSSMKNIEKTKTISI